MRVTVDVDIDTLPPGLQVGVGLLRDICQPGLLPIPQGFASIQRLDESWQLEFDTSPGPTGVMVRSRIVTHYTGQFVNADATPLSSTERCRPDVVRIKVAVQGIRPNGSLAGRTAEQVQIEVNPVSTVPVSPGMHPTTTGSVPSDMTRGALQTLPSTHRNVFYDRPTVNPTVQCRRPALIVGMPATLLARVTLQSDGHG